MVLAHTSTGKLSPSGNNPQPINIRLVSLPAFRWVMLDTCHIRVEDFILDILQPVMGDWLVIVA
ncbi:hypothetical protein [Endozoicomonas sp.]|uniref:hypothetical protein n=1 Tax=Endozoicomonas sp. TaxID=1892382 RepID=UPI00383BB990